MGQLGLRQRRLESASNVVEELVERDQLRRLVVNRERPPLDSRWIDAEIDVHVVEFCTDRRELARDPCPLSLRQSQRMRLEWLQQFCGGHAPNGRNRFRRPRPRRERRPGPTIRFPLARQ